MQILEELAKMNVNLEKKGGPSKAGKLFERILEKEQELLEKLHLPNTPYYQDLIHFVSIPWDKEIHDLINLLYREIESQKNKEKKSDIELLIEAKKSNRDPMFILPQLGIQTHVYTLLYTTKIRNKERFLGLDINSGDVSRLLSCPFTRYSTVTPRTPAILTAVSAAA